MEEDQVSWTQQPAIAEVVADSIGVVSPRITTLKLKYPKFIHGELMTHRVFSRNASSSRAIPTGKLRQDDIFTPKFRKNQAGMQAGEPLSEEDQKLAAMLWENAAEYCSNVADTLSKMGVHKQWANRMLEWFGWIQVVVTSTEWSNFFALRLDVKEDGTPVAQDEMWELAKAIKRAMDNSTPKLLRTGEWHLPFVRQEDLETPATDDELVKQSVARCARVSYLTHDMRYPSLADDTLLFDKLLGAHPIHASPAEHQATPDNQSWIHDDVVEWDHPELHGNLKGWCQYRKMLPGESL